MSAPCISGVCRVCGCTENAPCLIYVEIADQEASPCWWIDRAKTLCSNPQCLAVVPLEQIERELEEEANAIVGG